MKTYTHNLLSAAVVAAITFSGAAIADEYQTFETTTVTAGRFEQDLMETPMSVSVITADDIAKSGAQSIGALIESMTGVRINNDGGQGIKRAKIRGEDAFRSLVMIDGQKISEQKSMSIRPWLNALKSSKDRHLCFTVPTLLAVRSTSSRRKAVQNRCKARLVPV